MLIWTNGSDYCVADNAEMALGFWCEHTGESVSDYRAETWAPLPDDKELSFWVGADGDICEHDEGELVRKTAAAWVEEFDACYLGSTEH